MHANNHPHCCDGCFIQKDEIPTPKCAHGFLVYKK
jgi:hypothetical protein